MRGTVLSLMLATAITMLNAGCAAVVPVAPFQPPQGAAFSMTQAPLDIDYMETELGTKTGRASAYNILGLVSFGNASTQAAALNGGLTTINHADYATLNILYVFQRTQVIVYGD